MIQPSRASGSRPDDETIIRADDFHKAYDQTVAVSGVSFELRGGQILGLVGPNGAGKTTTLRALSAIIPSSRGQLSIRQIDVAADPVAARRHLAFIPDDPQLFTDLTVEEHLAFTAAAYQVADADAKAAALLEAFELTAKRRSVTRDLSRGMRQKVAICCAYLHDPVALMFDEPLTGLDPHGIRMLKQTIQQRAAQGAAVIVSSHLLAMVEDLCTHILILNRGRQRFFGPLAELRENFLTAEQEASLERIFFLATDCSDAASAAVVQAN